MVTEFADQVREIARHRDAAESEIIQQALEIGVETLWRDVVIGRYIQGELDREEAVEKLGADVVRQVDAAKDAIDEDIEWGLGELRA